jgi:predicted DNA-binding transcriptional regulator AlpA
VLQSLPISKSSLWRLVAADKLKVVRISKRMTLFSAQSVLDYLADCEKNGRE